MTTIDCIGCLHGHYPKLDGGDLLIVTGDLTARDKREEYLEFGYWIKNQKYRKKIIICGNHDGFIERVHEDCEPSDFDIPHSFSINPFKLFDCEYLCDSGTEFEGLKIWGSPWSLWFDGINPRCTAFTGNEEKLAEKFALIPHDIDILITHSPPYSILDKIEGEEHVGSKSLYVWFKYGGRPKLHIFSHIHEEYGQAEVFDRYNDSMVKHVNCSIMNEKYEPVNKPIRITL